MESLSQDERLDKSRLDFCLSARLGADAKSLLFMSEAMGSLFQTKDSPDISSPWRGGEPKQGTVEEAMRYFIVRV